MIMTNCGAGERGGLSETGGTEGCSESSQCGSARLLQGPELLGRAGDREPRMRSERSSRREKRRKGFVSYPVDCGLYSERRSHSEILNC